VVDTLVKFGSSDDGSRSLDIVLVYVSFAIGWQRKDYRHYNSMLFVSLIMLIGMMEATTSVSTA
jgi:hypothetical protein